MSKKISLAVLASIGLMSWGAWPSEATAPQFHIVIENASPYYLPAAARVPSGAPIRWENPTPSLHTITHDGCFTEEGPCAFDSGAVLPNGAYTLPGLPPGNYSYQCRLHPIMRGVVIVADPSPTASRT